MSKIDFTKDQINRRLSQAGRAASASELLLTKLDVSKLKDAATNTLKYYTEADFIALDITDDAVGTTYSVDGVLHIKDGTGVLGVDGSIKNSTSMSTPTLTITVVANETEFDNATPGPFELVVLNA